MGSDTLKLFALSDAQDLGARVARHLGVLLAQHEERDFEDGEHKARPLENVRGRDVYVLQSLYGSDTLSVNDKLARMLFFLGTVRDAGAARVTAVAPYWCYGRKDRRTKAHDPVTTRYVSMLFEAMGVDAVVTMDVHNPAAYENATRCRAEHLEAATLFAEQLRDRVGEEPLAVVSPDAGGVKRAERFREILEGMLGRSIGNAFMEKKRSEGVVSGEAVVGELEGRAAVVVDDLISSGTTLARAARACKDRGATRIFAAATHGLFVKDASEVIADPALDEVLIADTVPPFRLEADVLERKVTVLDTSRLFAQAIRRMHDGGSLVDLLEP